MKISELIKHVGDENIGIQMFGPSVVGATYRPKLKATEVRLITAEFSCNDLLFPGNKVGIILWIPREKLPPQQQPEGGRE